MVDPPRVFAVDQPLGGTLASSSYSTGLTGPCVGIVVASTKDDEGPTVDGSGDGQRGFFLSDWATARGLANGPPPWMKSPFVGRPAAPRLVWRCLRVKGLARCSWLRPLPPRLGCLGLGSWGGAR